MYIMTSLYQRQVAHNKNIIYYCFVALYNDVQLEVYQGNDKVIGL